MVDEKGDLMGKVNLRMSLKDLSIYILAAAIIIVNIPSISRQIGGAGVLFLLLLVFLINNKKYLKQRSLYAKTTVLAILYIAYEVVYEVLGISNCEYLYYYYTISFLFFAFIGPPLVEELDKHQQNIVLTAAVSSLLCVMYLNLRLRLRYGSSYVQLGVILPASTNAISTQYLSAIVLICGAFFTLLLYGKKHRLIILIMLSSMVAFEVFVGQRMIAILLLIAMMAAQFLVTVTTKRTLIGYATIISILVLAIVTMINLENILVWLHSVVDNTRITRRIEQLLYMIREREIQGAGGSLEVRFNLIMNSVKTFFSSPLHFLVGVGEDRSTNLLIGHHSQWVDQAAKYGIVGVALLFSVLRSCFKSVRTSMGIDKCPCLNKHFIIFEIYFIVRGLLGAVLYPYFGIALFVLIPIIMRRLSEEKIGENTIGGRV